MSNINEPERRQRSRSLGFAAVCLVALTLFPVAGEGQERVTLRGIVVDAETREPLRGVIVTSPLAGLTVLTDSLGVFSVSMIADERFEFAAEKLGYFPFHFALQPDTAGVPPTIPLTPSQAMLSGLAELEERLERRRRRQGGRIRLIEHEALMMSDETTAFTLVERHVPLARICQDRPEALCIPVGARERRIGVCIDEVVPPAGASGLGAYEPSDLWLVEIYDNGRRIRAYSRWFVARMAREEGGLIPLTMTCR